MNDDEDILTGSSETMADDLYDQYEDTYPDSVRAVEDVAGRVGLACADWDDVLEVAAGGVALACAPLVRAALPWWILAESRAATPGERTVPLSTADIAGLFRVHHIRRVGRSSSPPARGRGGAPRRDYPNPAEL